MGKIQSIPRNRRSARPDAASAISNTASIKIIRIAEALNRSASRVYGTQYGLKNTELRILANLGGPAPVSIGELSRRIRIDKAWISRSLTHLRSRKLVRVSSDPGMAGAKLVALTARGIRLLAQIAPVTVRRAARLLTGLDPLKSEAMLNRILANVLAIEDEETVTRSAPRTNPGPSRARR